MNNCMIFPVAWKGLYAVVIFESRGEHFERCPLTTCYPQKCTVVFRPSGVGCHCCDLTFTESCNLEHHDHFTEWKLQFGTSWPLYRVKVAIWNIMTTLPSESCNLEHHDHFTDSWMHHLALYLWNRRADILSALHQGQQHYDLFTLWYSEFG